MTSGPLSALLACSLSLALSLPAQAQKPAKPRKPTAAEPAPAPAKDKKKPPALMPWEQEQAAMKEKLNQITLPLLELREASLTDIVKHLTTEARKHDPKGKGVEITFIADAPKPPQKTDQAKSTDADKAKEKEKEPENDKIPPPPPDDAPIAVTLTLKNITLADALKTVAELSGTHLRITGKGVEFLTKTVYETAIVERTWKVDATAFTDADDKPLKFPADGKETSVKANFENRGVRFAPGASALYNAKTSVVTVKNNEVQLEIIEAIIGAVREGQTLTAPMEEPKK